VKHLAVRSMSVNSPNAPFTAPGIGDRIHLLTAAWCFSVAHSEPVTLHLTKDKFTGSKKSSFYEILELFPKNLIYIQMHDVSEIDDKEWTKYLFQKGIDSELFSYNDHLGRYESKEKLDISKYLSVIPHLQGPEIENMPNLPEKYVTSQWDSTAPTRTLSEVKMQSVLRKYEDLGYEVITVGGNSENELLRNSLETIASVIAKAKYHVGVNSGFMHLAFLYLPFERIHIYNEPKGYWEHHILRARDNGCKINYHYKKISLLARARIWLIYDNNNLFRVINRSVLLRKLVYNNLILKKIFKAEVR
jgi:hypothetical protein